MDNYKQKLIKYLKKLPGFVGGAPLELRPFAIEVIFDDIKKLIFEYAKDFNILSWGEQQLILQNTFGNVDYSDNTIQSIIDTINMNLPSFSLIWNSYYETLIIDKSYLFLNYPNNKPPSQNEILKIIKNNIDYYKNAYESFNKKEVRNDIFKIGSKLFRNVTMSRYDDPIIIKLPDSDDIIPMSEFCKTGYSKLLNCLNNKCSKIHFPDHINITAVCKNNKAVCRNFEKRTCSQFHQTQKSDLVFDTEKHLIGIKKSSLLKLPIIKDEITFKDGRIVFPDDPKEEKKPSIPSNPLDHTLLEYTDNQSKVNYVNTVRPAPSQQTFSLESLDELEKEIETIGRFRPNYGTEEEPIYEDKNKKTKRGTNSNSRRERKPLTDSELASELTLKNKIIDVLNSEVELFNNNNTIINMYYHSKYEELRNLKIILEELNTKLGDDNDIIIQIKKLREKVKELFIKFELFIKENKDELINFKQKILDFGENKNNLDKSIIKNIIRKRLEIKNKYNNMKSELDSMVSKYSHHLSDSRKQYSFLF
jgi:hypothetical protein